MSTPLHPNAAIYAVAVSYVSGESDKPALHAAMSGDYFGPTTACELLAQYIDIVMRAGYGN